MDSRDMLSLRTAITGVWSGLIRLHKDERGTLLETVLKIAIIALPILIVLYLTWDKLCPMVKGALQNLGVDTSDFPC